VGAAAVITAGGGDPAPPPKDTPAPVRQDGSEVDRSLDRLEGIVRQARERR
jgi:hypothetical protein